MRSAIILLALAVLVQVRAACFNIGVFGCIDVNTNCALLKACVTDIDEVCVNFPESLNDKVDAFMGYLTGRTMVTFYEHYDCQGAQLYQPGHRRSINPNEGVMYPAPWGKQASSVKMGYYIGPY
ncbi:hypothetical protein BGZ51_003147 [Haplosporangium sp. Z 767]|nr:hypothetical protein BGZ51_003147 [Haplosporangium sp. Z 767]KAF9185108.1 hypothetical protein BGZ50_003252 [Haplosporangium sp. Z 11]